MVFQGMRVQNGVKISFSFKAQSYAVATVLARFFGSNTIVRIK